MLNSSDDFTSGAVVSTRVRHRQKKGVPPAFEVSSTENSVNIPSAVNFSTNSLREISLNELADHSLRLCPRKPMFCSTPSAGTFGKRPCDKPTCTSEHSATPPSFSVSHIDVLSTFPADLDSPGQTIPPPYALPPSKPDPERKTHTSLEDQEPSGDLFLNASSKKDAYEETKSNEESQDIKSKSSEGSQSVNLLSTVDSECNTYFVTTAGELEWLIQVLKERCLSTRCTVELDRLDTLLLSQLCSQTIYSSCLGQSSSGYSLQTSGHLLHGNSIHAIDLSQSSDTPFNLQLSVTVNENSGLLQSPSESVDIKAGEKAAGLTAKLKQECLHDKFKVKIKRLAVSEIRKMLQGRDSTLKHHTDAREEGEGRLISGLQSESDTNRSNEETIKVGLSRRCSTISKETILSDKDESLKNFQNVTHKRKKTSLAPKQKKRRSTSKDRPGTNRKAYVSGLSVSRWKNKDGAGTHMFRTASVGHKTVDCSISELISTKHKPPKVRKTYTETQNRKAHTLWFLTLIIRLHLLGKISIETLLKEILAIQKCLTEAINDDYCFVLVKKINYV